METRANSIWVGAITLALIALLVVCAVWIARIAQGDKARYDIYFHQSVDGLAKGTGVSYDGVPAGQVTEIELSKNDPGLVRVRIAIDPHIPILEGTTAAIQGSFTGVSDIQLAGGIKGAPLITKPGPDGAPVIPTTRTGLGALLTSAPVLMEKLSTLTDQLTSLLSDDNQTRFAAILANTDRMTKHLADASPQVATTLAELTATLHQANATLAAFEKVAGSTEALLGPDAHSLASQLRTTLGAANAAMAALKAEIDDTRPATRELTRTTLPEAEAALRELRASSKALRQLTEKLDDRGVGAILSAPKLPEYHP